MGEKRIDKQFFFWIQNYFQKKSRSLKQKAIYIILMIYFVIRSIFEEEYPNSWLSYFDFFFKKKQLLFWRLRNIDP